MQYKDVKRQTSFKVSVFSLYIRLELTIGGSKFSDCKEL